MTIIGTDLKNAIETDSVALFGIEYPLPNIVSAKSQGRIEIFASKRGLKLGGQAGVKYLESLSDISRLGAQICLLDREAVKVLVAKYPNSAKYVLVRMRPSFDFVLSLVGLVRRLSKKTLRVQGTLKLKNDDNSYSRWLVLKNSTTQVKDPIYLSLSEEVGISGLISFLNEQKTRYVVPRFFEKFPMLHRPNGGDVDLLVEDQDAPIVREFLQNNPGRIPVDLHTVYGPAPGSADMPYFLPKLAKSMIENHVRGPIEVAVPNQDYYLYSFLYHILFHKGFFSGVISEKFPEMQNNSPENDYGAFAQQLAARANIEIGHTLESFEKVLQEAGFVPKLDTLAAISRLNKWVKWQYFKSKDIQEIGLSVLLLKKIAHKNGWAESIEKDIVEEGFTVIRHEEFNADRVTELSGTLRGGNWYVSSGEKEDYLPQSVYVLLDTLQNSPSKVASGKKEARIRILKTKLRKKYDPSLDSFIHTTDDTEQSWEYIEDIWPAELDDLKSELSKIVVSRPHRRKSIGQSFKTSMHVVKERLKDRILKAYE